MRNLLHYSEVNPEMVKFTKVPTCSIQSIIAGSLPGFK